MEAWRMAQTTKLLRPGTGVGCSHVSAKVEGDNVGFVACLQLY